MPQTAWTAAFVAMTSMLLSSTNAGQGERLKSGVELVALEEVAGKTPIREEGRGRVVAGAEQNLVGGGTGKFEHLQHLAQPGFGWPAATILPAPQCVGGHTHKAGEGWASELEPLALFPQKAMPRSSHSADYREGCCVKEPLEWHIMRHQPSGLQCSAEY